MCTKKRQKQKIRIKIFLTLIEKRKLLQLGGRDKDKFVFRVLRGKPFEDEEGDTKPFSLFFCKFFFPLTTSLV